jgi:hypothetical protein
MRSGVAAGHDGYYHEAGPKDPFAGLMPVTERATGRRGLWIIHQSCNYVTSEYSPDGFTLRLIAGDPG